jgi:hypothetical protein
MKIQKASEMKPLSENYNFVIIGESGSGKSHSLMTFPKGWKVLVLDMFGNKETYAGDEDIEVISFADLNPEAATAWPEIQGVKRELLSMLEEGKFRWKVLVVDTVTGLTRYIENYILMTNPEKRGIGGSCAKQHYRGISHVVGQFITSFLGFPISNVLVCHATNVYGEDEVAHKALITGATWRNSIYTYVHEVYHSYGHSYKEDDEKGESKTQYIWQTQPDIYWPMLKSILSRGGKYFGKTVEPNFSKLFFKRGVIEEDLIKEPKL